MLSGRKKNAATRIVPGPSRTEMLAFMDGQQVP